MTIVGVDWTTNASSPVLARIGPNGTSNVGATNLSQHIASWPSAAPAIASAGGSAWDAFGVWGLQKRVNLWADGTVTASFGDRCFTDTDTENMGQCMAQLPKHLYLVDQTLANHIRYYIADIADVGDTIDLADGSGTHALGITGGFTGFGDIHPCHIRNGVVKDYVYMSAYEGYSNVTTSNLDSAANVKPTGNANMASFRTKARHRNIGAATGWGVYDYLIHAELCMKWLVEYATFYSQGLYTGVCGVTTDGATNQAINTGYTAPLGNATGQVTVTHYQSPYPQVYPWSYRGVENLTGNIQKLVDGVVINPTTHEVWIANNGFLTDTFTAPYVQTGLIPQIDQNGYTKVIAIDANFDWGFLSQSLGANSAMNTYLCCSGGSNHVTGTLLSAPAAITSLSQDTSIFGMSMNSTSANLYRYIGTRIMYIG